MAERTQHSVLTTATGFYGKYTVAYSGTECYNSGIRRYCGFSQANSRTEYLSEVVDGDCSISCVVSKNPVIGE